MSRYRIDPNIMSGLTSDLTKVCCMSGDQEKKSCMTFLTFSLFFSNPPRLC